MGPAGLHDLEEGAIALGRRDSLASEVFARRPLNIVVKVEMANEVLAILVVLILNRETLWRTAVNRLTVLPWWVRETTELEDCVVRWVLRQLILLH